MQTLNLLKPDAAFMSPLDKALDTYAARVEALKTDVERVSEEAATLANMRELRLFKGLPEEHIVKTVQLQMRSLFMTLNGRRLS